MLIISDLILSSEMFICLLVPMNKWMEQLGCWISALQSYDVSFQKFDPSYPWSQNIFFFRNVMAIEYEEIKKATKNFQPHLLLGEGGFGPVYKGWLHQHYLTAVKPGSGIAVAVKKMDKEGWQGHNQWVDEIHYLSQIHHPNMVKLIGYSFETDDRIVVYEFMPKGSLDNHLFTSRHHSLPWATRMKVGVGAARALAFLHGSEIPVIHRNIKCSDILLDADFNPKLSDFCLAIDGPTGDMTHVETRVMATYGYAAPEYMATGSKSETVVQFLLIFENKSS